MVELKWYDDTGAELKKTDIVLKAPQMGKLKEAWKLLQKISSQDGSDKETVNLIDRYADLVEAMARASAGLNQEEFDALTQDQAVQLTGYIEELVGKRVSFTRPSSKQAN